MTTAELVRSKIYGGLKDRLYYTLLFVGPEEYEDLRSQSYAADNMTRFMGLRIVRTKKPGVGLE